jgi:CheY-like chemotaxis protein
MNLGAVEPNNRILVIDDNPSIHEDFRKILASPPASHVELDAAEEKLFDEPPVEEEELQFELDSAYQGKEGLTLVQRALDGGRPYALAFVDVRMPPGWDGVETIIQLWRSYPELQVVICTAYSDYSWEDIRRQLGRSDNMVILKKPFDNIEVLQLAHALTKKWLLTQQEKVKVQDLDRMVEQRTQELRAANEKLHTEVETRRQTETALRLSEERFEKAFSASPLAMAILTLKESRYLDVNESFVKLTEMTRQQFLGQLAPQMPARMEEPYWNRLQTSLQAG